MPLPLVEDTRIRLDFSVERRITASAGCNSLGGTFEIDDERIIVADLSTTEIGCDPARHAQDEWLAAFLVGDPAHVVDDDHLQLRSADTVIGLLDRRVADPDRPLEGTVWQVDGTIDGDVVSSVSREVTATVHFESGSVVVEVEDCNQGSAEVEIGPTTLQLGPMVMTDRGCNGAPEEVEAAVAAVLDGRVGYAIEAASLTLTNDDGQGLVLRALA